MEIQELKRHIEKLNEGKVIVHNLSDNKNFANLIQRQATLVESLEKEKKFRISLENKLNKNQSNDKSSDVGI